MVRKGKILVTLNNDLANNFCCWNSANYHRTGGA